MNVSTRLVNSIDETTPLYEDRMRCASNWITSLHHKEGVDLLFDGHKLARIEFDYADRLPVLQDAFTCGLLPRTNYLAVARYLTDLGWASDGIDYATLCERWRGTPNLKQSPDFKLWKNMGISYTNGIAFSLPLNRIDMVEMAHKFRFVEDSNMEILCQTINGLGYYARQRPHSTLYIIDFLPKRPE